MLASGYLGWRYVSGIFGALMIACLFGITFIHETPEWLLETKKFDRAIKALEFYQTNKESHVADSVKRKSISGEEKSYNELVKMYRVESRRSSINESVMKLDSQPEANKQSWK